MLAFFRRNLIFNLIALLLFAIILHGYYFISFPEVSAEGVGTMMNDWIKSLIQAPILKAIVAITLITIQAYLLNDLVVKHKFSRMLSTIPGALFILLSVYALEPYVLHPILIANLFFLLSVRSLFNIYKRHNPIATLFNSGFFLMIASLIYPGYIIFILLLLLGIFSLRNLDPREVLQLLGGIFIPVFLTFVALFYLGVSNELTTHFFGAVGWKPWVPDEGIAHGAVQFFKPALFLILIIVTTLMHFVVKKKKKYDVIKKIELTYWMLFLSLPAIFIVGSVYEYKALLLVMLTVPLSIVLGLIMEQKKNSILKEFIFLILVLGFFAFQLKEYIG